MNTTFKWYLSLSAAFGIACGAASYVTQAHSADLGKGGDYADLEERIAELEATTARKGNRKVSLTISAEVSKALLFHNIDGLPGANKFRVIDNPNSGTKVRLAGEAKISASVKAGFLFEYGFDETRGDGLGPIGQFLISDAELRRSAIWLETAVGRVTVGKYNLSTDGIAEIDLSNANLASRMMSVEPIWSYLGIGAIPVVGAALNPTPFYDLRAQIVRYDTPTLAGFTGSASWGGGQTLTGDDLWDVALRYAGEFGGFKMAAGGGYRVEKHSSIGADDQRTISGSASVMHALSGLFLTGAYADQKNNLIYGDIRMWMVRGGIERKFMEIGATTAFIEYGDHKLTTLNVSSDFWGAGVSQAIDAAAMDVFVSFRKYDIGSGMLDAHVAMFGGRVRF